jgi:hypothetical protein
MIPPKVGDIWYRYEEVTYHPGVDEYDEPLRGPGRVEVNCYEWRVTKVTPKGVRVGWGMAGLMDRFILLDARKRWAYPTKELALESFIARKERQLRILRAQVETVEKALAIVKRPMETRIGCFETFDHMEVLP